jgi:hypothetical protein
MYQRTTQNESVDYYKLSKRENISCLNPRKETLALIMQFARVFYVEKGLPDSLSEMILN